ncbi:MAG: MotA/TolQ/ExbB proton channel family protein [Planctomycetes bacterium]|nr:MotA/TolQ/ExbB proton channel family protein [Planctomycetota bacterium]
MLEHILKGGFMMFPLVILSVLAIAVIIDRMRVFRMARIDVRGLQRSVLGCLRKGDIAEAVEACKAKGGPVAAVLVEGLVKYHQMIRLGRQSTEMEEGVTQAMSDFSPQVLETLEKRLNLLTLIASTAPLLGMTGTVTGMISSFKGMAEAGGLDASVVSNGISEALITTAAGLIIALPAVVAYNIFSKQVDHVTLEIEETTTELVNHIATEQTFA